MLRVELTESKIQGKEALERAKLSVTGKQQALNQLHDTENEFAELRAIYRKTKEELREERSRSANVEQETATMRASVSAREAELASAQKMQSEMVARTRKQDAEIQ